MSTTSIYDYEKKCVDEEKYDNDKETESESTSEIDSEIQFYEKLDETEIEDLISCIYDLIQEYLKEEILKMSKPDFHKEMIDDVTHILFQSLQDADLCCENDYDSLYDFVDIHTNEWFENKEDMNYPFRCIEHYKTNYHYDHYGITDLYFTQKINHLRELNEKSPKQRTPEWYQKRYNMMTASNLWQALNTESQRNRLIYEKCKPLDFGYTENKWINTDNSLHWGVKYEPITARVYEKITGAKVEEFGCIQHQQYPFIGASPDGIVTNIDSPFYGRMLEIKNIYNREMDGIPSEAYWIQIQIQMECCNLDICDFVETRFKEYDCSQSFFEEDDNDRLRGIILHFIPKDGTTNVPFYKYMPLDISLNQNAIDEWIECSKCELPEYAIYTKIYWYLDEIIMTTILRNQRWFDSALPTIKETWDTIEKERILGYEHRAAKKRIINDVIVVNSHDGTESHIIKNMPSTTGGICLIKIDAHE